MRKLNQMDDSARAHLAGSFFRAMHLAQEIFGPQAFRKPKFDEWGQVRSGRNPISKPLFESWSVALSNLSQSEAETALSCAETIRSHFYKLVRDDTTFITSISYSTGSPSRVLKRFSAIEKLIDTAIVVG
ncbi:hypothetical protein D3C80_656290 [compost metagenome]